MSDNPKREGHFWTSLPGVLTGLAAIITAGTGLYLALRQTPATESVAKPASALTLFDLRGVYTLTHIDPGSPIHPQGLGIAIFPTSATGGRAEYRLPLGKLDEQNSEDAILADESSVVFTGSKLQIKFGKTMSLWREVEFNDPYLVLSWHVDGRKHSWTFRRND